MNRILEKIEERLDHHICGFHQYVLNPPVHISFASENLCHMLGYCKQDLQDETTDWYAAFVHPADRKKYADFLLSCTKKEQTATAQYRMIKKNGEILYVQDTLTSYRLTDGTLVGDSVLADITEVQKENDNLRFLNETIPCGFLRYTCEKLPKITYINDRMLSILGLSQTKAGEIDYLEMYRDNIYFMIPMEERSRFARFLERVQDGNETIAGEMTVLRCDGSKIRVYGWVTKSINAQGQEEFQSICMDVTERYQQRKEREIDSYLHALTEVYNKIFEYDFGNKTVKCLCGYQSDAFKGLKDLPMQMEEATAQWVAQNVMEEDRERMQQFFLDYYSQVAKGADAQPPQVRYRAISSSGEIKTYAGIFLKVNPSVSLFCCRNAEVAGESPALLSENISLKNMNENMQELVMRFTEGIAAFEVEDGYVKPLYASDNVCQFFGYTKEEWVHMAQEQQSIKKFVARSGVPYEKFQLLLESGEAEFVYTDVNSGKSHPIKAVCSNMFAEDASRQYVMLYHTRPEAEIEAKPKVYIRTFGYFDVFVDGKAIAFRNEKAKELFALLTDRRGGYVTSEEAIGYLWEDESANSVTLARYRKVALRLKNILEEYGIGEVIESVNGRRRIVTEKVQCDLYEYLTQKEEYAQLFKGSYLSNYSWGENTLGELLGEPIY